LLAFFVRAKNAFYISKLAGVQALKLSASAP
jgi:hypothetical protein